MENYLVYEAKMWNQSHILLYIFDYNQHVDKYKACYRYISFSSGSNISAQLSDEMKTPSRKI